LYVKYLLLVPKSEQGTFPETGLESPGGPKLAEYNLDMARGWESKSVEAQQSEAAEQPSPRKALLTPEQRALEAQRDGLRLSRKHVWQELQRAPNARYKAMMEAALVELDAKLARLG
jgi:hypothetical protein